MIDLFKTKQETVAPEVLETVKSIHREFDEASNNAIKEAWKIANSTIKDGQVELLNKLSGTGFGNCSNVKEMLELTRKKTTATQNFNKYDGYGTKYPNHKFITVDQVTSICEKYNLICGQANWFKGEIPEKNAKEIIAFKAHPEDIYFHVYDGIYYNGAAFPTQGAPNSQILNNKEQEQAMDRLRDNLRRQQESYQRSLRNLHSPIGASMGSLSSNPISSPYPLFICAPESDMNLPAYVEKKGVFAHAHIPDPIVLHFVKDGFIIVSKWGPEANDQELVIETLN